MSFDQWATEWIEDDGYTEAEVSMHVPAKFRVARKSGGVCGSLPFSGAWRQ